MIFGKNKVEATGKQVTLNNQLLGDEDSKIEDCNLSCFNSFDLLKKSKIFNYLLFFYEQNV
jgi:hypothetical protein